MIMTERNTQPKLLDNWIGWLQAKIPALKESHNIFWLKQAMEGYKSASSKTEPTHSEITQVQPVAPIDKTLTAEQYIRRLYPLSDKFSRLGCEKIAEAYANLRVEQEKEEWEKEKQEIVRHPLTCNHCGDYYGVNIDHKCFKCLKPLF